MCGCKMSKNAPFCDAITCQQILKGQEFKVEEDILYLEEEEDEMPEVPKNEQE